MIDIKQFRETYGRKEMRLLAESVGSNVRYFDLIVAGKRKTGVIDKITKGDVEKSLTFKLVQARPDLFSNESLRPDVYPSNDVLID